MGKLSSHQKAHCVPVPCGPGFGEGEFDFKPGEMAVSRGKFLSLKQAQCWVT